MNAADSSPSIDSNNLSQHSVANTPPAKSHNGETAAYPNKHDYFVPVIIVIVFGITVVATFFDTRIDRHTVHARTVKQNHTNTAAATDRSAAAGPESSTKITQNSTAVTDDTAVAAGFVNSASIKPLPTGKAPSQAAAVRHNRVHHTGKTAYYAYTRPPPAAFGRSVVHPDYYTVMIAARRRAYEDSLQMQREDLYRLNEYPTAIPRRIEHPRW